MIWTVPNVLTVARLLAAPGVAVPFLVMPRPEADWWALGIFLAAAVTDFLDGWLARRLGQESRLGAILDPVADKAMVVIALALLMARSGIEAWLVVPAAAILFREMLVSGLREALGPGARLSVTRLAKWKTTAQMLAIALLLAPAPLGLEAAGMVVLWGAAGLTIVTGWDYAAKALRYIRTEEDGR